MIFYSKLALGDGGGIQEEYIEASSVDEAKKLHLEYLDDDIYDWKSSILSEDIHQVDSLPDGWNPKTPNLYKVYRGKHL